MNTADPSPLLSAVICTWNRSRLLEDTVRSLLACARSEKFKLELLIVDNGSTDDTATRLAQFAPVEIIRIFREETPGLSHARNLGISKARGEWILFIDDDVLLPTAFLNNYAEAVASLPWAGFLAGAVIPDFSKPLPPWATEVLIQQPWCFSALDLGGESRPLLLHQHPFGANMAVRAEIARRFPFKGDLGFRHGVLVPGEETAFFRAIETAGYRGAWVSNVALRHRLPPSRATFRFLLRRAFGQGRADAIMAHQDGRSSTWVLGEIFRVFGALTMAVLTRPQSIRLQAIAMARRVAHVLTWFRLSFTRVGIDERSLST